jgi:hypothetical protein
MNELLIEYFLFLKSIYFIILNKIFDKNIIKKFEEIFNIY